MADLRSRFLEDYAGGLLNVSRQELSTTGEVLSQDGFTSDGALFVEDGSGVKSGLLLGNGIAECIDPTTEQGLVNVRFADRTYASIRDLKTFTSAMASAQAALADASGRSITNLEQAYQLLEDNVSALDENVREALRLNQENIDNLSANQSQLNESLNLTRNDVNTLDARVTSLEKIREGLETIEFLDTSINEIYYSGTIEIVGGVVTGTDTTFNTELDVGSVFVAIEPGSGRDIEFVVTSFDSINPGTTMTVLPSDVDIQVGGGVLYKKNQSRIVAEKVNEVITTLKELQILL